MLAIVLCPHPLTQSAHMDPFFSPLRSRMKRLRCAALLLAWLVAIPISGLSQDTLLGVAPESHSTLDSAGKDWLLLARRDVSVLTSDRMAGRGYTSQGHLQAAKFVAARWQELGLRPAVPETNGDSGFFQTFPFSINLLQDGMLVLDADTLQIGDDFLVGKYSGKGEISGKIQDLGYGIEPKVFDKSRGKIVVLRDGWPEGITEEARQSANDQQLANILDRIAAIAASEPLGFVVLVPKLTHGFVREQAPFPILEVLSDKWPSKVRSASIQTKASIANFRSQNVIAYLPGSCDSDEFVVVCAHYDHLGMMGSAIFPGANDNASGIAMLLSMAEHFVQEAHRPEKNMLFIAFGGEEVGLVGSQYYVMNQPVVPLEKISFLLNLDLMGNGSEGIMAVGGKDFPALFDQLSQANDELQAVPAVRARPNAPNSDHYWFLEEGVEGFFIYTLGGPPHYHDVHDTSDHLELSKYVEVRALLLHFLAKNLLSCEN